MSESLRVKLVMNEREEERLLLSTILIWWNNFPEWRTPCHQADWLAGRRASLLTIFVYLTHSLSNRPNISTLLISSNVGTSKSRLPYHYTTLQCCWVFFSRNCFIPPDERLQYFLQGLASTWCFPISCKLKYISISRYSRGSGRSEDVGCTYHLVSWRRVVALEKLLRTSRDPYEQWLRVALPSHFMAPLRHRHQLLTFISSLLLLFPLFYWVMLCCFII